MPSFSTRRQVLFSPQQMFSLVADIEKYPEFVPLCEALRIRKRKVDKLGHPVLVANMTCGYKAIRESFVSQVSLDDSSKKIRVEYIDGPFSFLENTWTFHERPGGCEIEFAIAYEFKSRMLGVLVGGLFDKAFRKFAQAFEERAVRVYGSNTRKVGPPAMSLADPATP